MREGAAFGCAFRFFEKEHPKMAKPNKTPVLARVLCDGLFGKVDDIVEVPTDVAEESSELDPHPDAVSYVQTLPKNNRAPDVA